MSLRRAASVTLLAASLAVLSAACGRQQPAAGAPPSDGAGGGSSASVARKVSMATGTGGGRGVRTVLDDERDLARFSGWFARSDPETARDIVERAKGTDFSRNVLVGWAQTTGCAVATDAALLVRSDDGGNGRLLLRTEQDDAPRECLAPNRVIAVFEVARDRVPDKPLFGTEGSAADPAGPGTTVAFVRQEPAEGSPASQATGDATDVTTEQALSSFLGRLPDAGAATVRKQLAAHPLRSGERRLGFVLSGCAPTGAALLLSPDDEPSAVTTGGETVRCVRAQPYAAVISVPENLLPRRDGPR